MALAEWANFLSPEINQSGCNSPENPSRSPRWSQLVRLFFCGTNSALAADSLSVSWKSARGDSLSGRCNKNTADSAVRRVTAANNNLSLLGEYDERAQLFIIAWPKRERKRVYHQKTLRWRGSFDLSRRPALTLSAMSKRNIDSEIRRRTNEPRRVRETLTR
jgi:hypothetical protein